jgi:hypothetical protein
MVVGAACLVVLTACPESGDDSADRPPRRVYIRQADRICLDFARKGAALTPAESMADAVRVLARAESLGERAYDRFGSLLPAEDAQEVHDALLSALDDALHEIRKAREAAETGDPEALRAALKKAERVGSRADKQAKKYGYKVCGSEDELRL